MSEKIVLKADERNAVGSAAVRNLRREGLLPAIIYGAGSENKKLQLDQHNFEQMLRHHAAENMIVDLDIAGGESESVLLKSVQHHPVSGVPLHIDFQRISMSDKLEIEIPISLVGDPVGVTTGGGVLELLQHTLYIKCLPNDILETIEVDVSELELGGHLSVADIKLDPEKYEIVADEGIAIATVAAPRTEEEEEELEESIAGEGLEEPEVIGEESEEDEEGADAEEESEEDSEKE